MTGKTSIQWATMTWNPSVGCTRVSAGCDNCYAFALHDKRYVQNQRAADAIGDGGLALGVYQWHAATWRQYAPVLGYRVSDITDVRAQTRLTAWAFANGHAGLWTCR